MTLISEIPLIATEINDGDLFEIETEAGQSKQIPASLVSPIRFKKVSLSAAQIKVANSFPVNVIAAPGAGYTILIIGGALRLNFVSIPFASTLISLFSGGVSYKQAECPNLDYTASFIESLVLPAANVNMAEDMGIFLQTDTDSVIGNGSLDLYLTYQIIKL